MFSVCPPAGGGGVEGVTPSPSQSTSTDPMSFLWGVPQLLVPGPFPGVPQSWLWRGGPHGRVPLARDGVLPQPGMGVHPRPGWGNSIPQDRTAEGVFTTWLAQLWHLEQKELGTGVLTVLALIAFLTVRFRYFHCIRVCLLRSPRRTVFYYMSLGHDNVGRIWAYLHYASGFATTLVVSFTLSNQWDLSVAL